MHKIYEVIIVGAGPAGLGLGAKLQALNIDYLILEKDTIGSSFLDWSHQTRFITPSFPSNAFGLVDLNSIEYSDSPGLSAKKEHLSGNEYAKYLQAFAKNHNLKIQTGEEVLKVIKNNDVFTVSTKDTKYNTKFICYGTGEYGFPSVGGIQGGEYCTHSSEIENYDIFKDTQGEIPIVGGYESAIDLGSYLIKLGKKIALFSSEPLDDYSTSDPSKTLSLFSMERLQTMQTSPLFDFSQSRIESVSMQEGKYILKSGQKEFVFENKPILATGFNPKLSSLGNGVDYRDDGNPEVNSVDELKSISGVFVLGTQLRHDDIIFCFIYKFRQRFGVVALEIAKRLRKDLDYNAIKKVWKQQGFYLDDLTNCGDECAC